VSNTVVISSNTELADKAVRPLISVLMPIYNSNPDWLSYALESVLHQSFSNWELCIADDASTNHAVPQIIKKYVQRDDRIKICFRTVNGHISEASNTALEMSIGDWIALMDHDDLLSPNALQEVANVISAQPAARLIYSDEDKIDGFGIRYDPYFKPSWNRDLYYSHNMISHLGVYHAETVRKIGGFRKGLEGSQDYDLALRFIEQIGDEQIHHIPKVIYHWRSHSESTASSGEAKPYAVAAGERAIIDHLVRTGSRGKCTYDGIGGYRVEYPTPERKVAVSALILTNGNADELGRCIEGIKLNSSSIDWEFRILPSSAEAARFLRFMELPSKVLLEEKSEGEVFSTFLNRASLNAKGEVLWYLHDRLELLSDDAIKEMISQALRPKIGAVGGKLLYPDGRVRQAGLLLGYDGISRPSFHHYDGDSYGYMGRLILIQNYSAVSKDCMAIEKKKFIEVTGFDERHLKSHHLDVDLCLRLKEAGYRTLWTPYARFCDSRPRFSIRGISDRLSKEFRQDCAYMQSRWSDVLKNDPSYNPNLNQRKKDFNY